MNPKLQKKSHDLTRALAKAVLACAVLDEAIEEEPDFEQYEVIEDSEIAKMRDELEASEAENVRLSLQYNDLVCAGFPGEAMLVIKAPDGERKPTEADLRRLCDANGLHVLKKGHYICSSCTGVRTTKQCSWCEADSYKASVRIVLEDPTIRPEVRSMLLRRHPEENEDEVDLDCS